MTINSEIDRERTPTRRMQIGFYVTSVVFNVCLIAQLLTVGVAYFNNPAWWNIHVWLVRGYGGLSLVLLGWSFLTPFSRQNTTSHRKSTSAAGTTICPVFISKLLFT